jgi:hypothetical protein
MSQYFSRSLPSPLSLKVYLLQYLTNGHVHLIARSSEFFILKHLRIRRQMTHTTEARPLHKHENVLNQSAPQFEASECKLGTYLVKFQHSSRIDMSPVYDRRRTKHLRIEVE